MASAGLETGLRLRVWRVRPSTVGLAGLVVATTWLRFTVGRDQPLWLDETWTGMVASRPTLRALVHELHQDVNGPLYYVVAWAAAPVLGLSNSGLRLPAAVFGSIAPLLCLTLPQKRIARLWCALSALWVAGLIYSQEARCFTLLWALSTASTAAYARLLAAPRRRTALAWVAVTSLAVLTHYFAVFLAVAQAALLVRRKGWSVLRLWPAALIALPAFGWLAFHTPRVAGFSAAEVGWYPPLRFWTGVYLARELAGSDLLAALLPLLAFSLLLAPALNGRPPPSALTDAALASAIGLLLALFLDALHPSLTARYLFPFVPGLLLWIAAMALRSNRSGAVALALCAFGLPAVLWAVSRPAPLSRFYSWEAASGWIGQAKPAGLVFVWDNPSAQVIWPDSMARVGAFFLQRAGQAPPSTSMVVRGRDPNLELRALPQAVAILWVYDTNVHGTEAVAHPPNLAGPGRECRAFGRWWMNVYACRPRAPVTTPGAPQP
jgi:hypothetical protein